MMRDELITAWATAAREHNEAIQTQACGACQYGKVPAMLQVWEMEFLERLYSRDEFDALCGGADRHARFGTWAAGNYHSWTRTTERAFKNFIRTVNAAAEFYPLPKISAA